MNMKKVILSAFTLMLALSGLVLSPLPANAFGNHCYEWDDFEHGWVQFACPDGYRNTNGGNNYYFHDDGTVTCQVQATGKSCDMEIM